MQGAAPIIVKPKKRGKSEAAQLKKYENSVVKKKPTREAKPTRKKELKHPRDASIDARLSLEQGVTVSTSRESLEGSHKRKRDAESLTQLLPLRENHNRTTLSIRINRAPPPLNRVEDSEQEGELYKQLVGVNAFLYKQRNETISPLEELACLGLLSTQAIPVREKQSRMANQLEADADFMRRQLQQLSRSTDGVEAPPHNAMVVIKDGVKKSRPHEKATGKTVLVKLGVLIGSLNYAFGYERRASCDHKEYVFNAYERDLAERREKFFLHDAIDEETPFRSPPARFRMFRELVEKNMARYKDRASLPHRASSSVPKSDLETLNRDYFTKYRKRPREGEQTCFKGTRCLFYIVGGYIGLAFYTQSQCDAGTVVENALCIDCLLQKWTLQCVDNIADARPQTVPFNHFSVMVGPGE